MSDSTFWFTAAERDARDAQLRAIDNAVAAAGRGDTSAETCPRHGAPLFPVPELGLGGWACRHCLEPVCESCEEPESLCTCEPREEIQVMTSNAERVAPDDLNKLAEFDHLFTVTDDGAVIDAEGYAPTVYVDCDDDGQIVDGPHIDGHGWSFVNGYSGQDCYSGPIMHPSEYLGGGMASDVLADPGTYVVCEVIDPDDMDSDPIGWVLLKRDEPALIDGADEASS